MSTLPRPALLVVLAIEACGGEHAALNESAAPDAGSATDFDQGTTPLLDPHVPGIRPLVPHLPEPGFDGGPCAVLRRPAHGDCTWSLSADVMQHFAPNTARVTYQDGSATTALQYDPTCTARSAWHYVDAQHPDRVQLCETTCAKLLTLGDPATQLEYPCAYPDAL